MKKLFIFIVFIMVIGSFSSAYAANRAGDLSIGGSVGGYFFEGNQDYKDSIAWGVRAGYNFTDNIATEIFVTLAPDSEFEEDFRDGDTNRIYIAGIEGIYNFLPNSRFVPYIAVGIGAIHYSSADDDLVPSKLTVDYGAGLKCFVTKRLALRADIRHVLPIGNDDEYGDNPHDTHNDLMATIGFSYYFNFGGDK